MYTDTKEAIKLQRWLIVITIILANLYAAAFIMMGLLPVPSPSLALEQVIEIYAENNLQFRIGVCIMIVTGAWYLPWSVVLCLQMARIEKGVPVMSIVQVLASTNGTWLFAIPPVFWGVVAFSIDRDPSLSMLMHEFSWLYFVTPASFFLFQLIPIAVVSLSKDNTDPHSPFPRWLGWLTVWSAITGELGFLAQLFKSGPFAWNGLFPFYLPIAVFTVWVVCLVVTLWKSLKYQELSAQANQSPGY